LGKGRENGCGALVIGFGVIRKQRCTTVRGLPPLATPVSQAFIKKKLTRTAKGIGFVSKSGYYPGYYATLVRKTFIFVIISFVLNIRPLDERCVEGEDINSKPRPIHLPKLPWSKSGCGIIPTHVLFDKYVW
jgi:hypothetical protein